MTKRYIRKTREFLIHFSTHPKGYVTECGSSSMRASNATEIVNCAKCRNTKAFKAKVQP